MLNCNKLVFVTASQVCPSPIFVVKAGAYPSRAPQGIQSKYGFFTLPENIKYDNNFRIDNQYSLLNNILYTLKIKALALLF